MKRRLFFILGLTVLLCVASAQAAGGPWPKTTQALSGWEGPKKATLRSDLPDPLASEAVRGLLEILLEKGYAVRMAAPTDAAGEGIVLDHRTAGQASVLVLSAADDGRILVMERIGAAAPVAAQAEKEAAEAPAEEEAAVVTQAAAESPQAPAATVVAAPFEVAGHPRRLATAKSGEDGEVELYLLHDDRLETVRLTRRGVETVAACAAPIAGARALYLDAGELDRDGGAEVFAVWGEEERDIYQGTETRIHGWVLSGATHDGACRKSEDFGSYLRSVGGRLYRQEKGTFAPFRGPVREVVFDQGRYRDATAVLWAGRSLYAATPVSEDEALIWSPAGNLQLVSRVAGEALVGGILLADLGPFAGPEVASRLKSPEFRSGFAKEDRVLETYHPLSRRLALAGDGHAYTIRRGRSVPIPLLGSAAGSDALVRIRLEPGRLRLESPFPSVDSYLIDFALMDDGGSPGAVLLLNEKEDGSGRAYLLHQTGE